MAINTINTKNLRAKLLQHIVASRFEATFGPNWWEQVLLSHMREESMVQGRNSGAKYAIALRKYGRAITIQDLDTTVTSTIILYDPYFKSGKYAAVFTSDEITIAKKLHTFRNKLSHEESNTKNLEEAEKLSLRVMRSAIDALQLVDSNPVLAREILTEYFSTFSDSNETAADQSRMALSGRFEEAENLYKWEVDKAIPIYQELAEKGFLAAQKRLLQIYTHTVKQFDLNKAVYIAEHFRLLSEQDIETIYGMRDALPHVLWANPAVCTAFKRELESGRLIQNAQLLQYIQLASDQFNGGLISILLPEMRNEAIYHELSNIPPNFNITTSTENASCIKALRRIAANKNFDFNQTKIILSGLVKEEYIPLIEHFAKESIRRGVASKADQQKQQIIQHCANKGSAVCKEWMIAQAQTTPVVKANFSNHTDEKSARESEKRDKELEDEVEKLRRDNSKLKALLIVAGIADIALFLLLIL